MADEAAEIVYTSFALEAGQRSGACNRVIVFTPRLLHASASATLSLRFTRLIRADGGELELDIAAHVRR